MTVGSRSPRAITLFALLAAGCWVAGGCNAGKLNLTGAPLGGASTAPGSTPGGTPPGGTGPVGSGSSATAKIWADTDRDGVVTTADDANKDTFTAQRGAVFVFNDDDDDGNKQIDGEDTIPNGADDLKTMARVVVGQVSGSPTAVLLNLTPAGAPVRVFRMDSSGKMNELLPSGQAQAQLNLADVTAGEVNLYVEATAPRSTKWDGNIALEVEVQGPQASKDKVALRCAPAIFVDNTRQAQRVYIMKIDAAQAAPNDPFWAAMKTGLAAQQVPLIEVDQNKFGFDRWVQDGMQLGYQGYPGANNQMAWLEDFNQLERKSNGPSMFDYVPDEILGKGKGMNYAGSGQAEACNFGGNLEVLPPHTAANKTYPFGRIVIGGGNKGTVNGGQVTRHMNQEEVDFLNAQVQGPAIEISSEWLAVGHVDETFQVVPNLKATAGARTWKILWASPALARKALTDMKAKGNGSVHLFVGRKSEETIDAVLTDAALMTFNDQVQTRLDANKAALIAAAALTAADFVEVPVLFEKVPYQGVDFGIALNPGVQNEITINDTLYIPDPEGPKDAGKDVWQAQIEAALSPIGLKAVFVDVFESYHELMGEAHCGSNVFYKPYDEPWWTK